MWSAMYKVGTCQRCPTFDHQRFQENKMYKICVQAYVLIISPLSILQTPLNELSLNLH